MRVVFRTIKSKIGGLDRAPAIFAKHLKGSLEGIGKNLVRSSRTRMRDDLGNERRSLEIKVTGSQLKLNLLVVSHLMQAFTDAYGLKRGTFPPFGPSSRIYSWATRRENTWKTEKPKKLSDHKREVIRRRLGKEKLRHSKRKIRKIKQVGQFRQSAVLLKGRTTARNNNIRRIAFLVARSIYRKGIKPSHWNKLALEANMRRIRQDLQNGLERAAKEIARG